MGRYVSNTVTTSSSQTLTNKTINRPDNTLTNLAIADADVDAAAAIALTKLSQGGTFTLTSDILIQGNLKYLTMDQSLGSCGIRGPPGAPGYNLQLSGGFLGGMLLVGGAAGTSQVAINGNNVLFPVQAAGATPPTYVAGGIYYNTTSNKMMIGGAAGWETVTSA